MVWCVYYCQTVVGSLDRISALVDQLSTGRAAGANVPDWKAVSGSVVFEAATLRSQMGVLSDQLAILSPDVTTAALQVRSVVARPYSLFRQS